MISNNMVAIELIPTKSFKPTDFTTLAGLYNEVVTQSVAKGQAINSTELSASTSSISIPTGMDAMTVTMTGTNSLAGYLQPGSRVDVYANITKVSHREHQSGHSGSLYRARHVEHPGARRLEHGPSPTRATRRPPGGPFRAARRSCSR